MGFREKDGERFLNDFAEWKFDIRDKLVPVVSLQELKEWCKRKRKWSAHVAVHRQVVSSDDLLSWAEKQAGAKKDG